MTKAQYDLLKQEILNKYGKPIYDQFNPENENESAKRLKALLHEYRQACLAASRDANKRKKNESLKDIAKDIPEEKKKEYVRKKQDPCFVTLADLVAFDDEERDVIAAFFADLSLTPQDLADKFKTLSRQKIVSLLASGAFKVLYAKVFDRILPLESLVAIRQAMKEGDSKVTLEVARNYNLIKNESLDINNRVKPIEDPEAIKLLKQLGDRLTPPSDNVRT